MSEQSFDEENLHIPAHASLDVEADQTHGCEHKKQLCPTVPYLERKWGKGNKRGEIR
jgi:hypothetical protein